MHNSDIIILRSVFKIPKCTMEPAIDPNTGRYPSVVKRVNSQGDMVLNDEDRKSNKHFIAENEAVEIYDGKSFDLTDEVQKAQWEAIKFSKRITQDRWTKNSKGDFVIDGDTRRYGTAEFYIERPGKEAESRNTKKRQVHEATKFIYDDSKEGRYLKAKLLNNPMDGLPESEVEDYLVGVAAKTPDKIRELYTGSDTHLRVLLIESIEKHVVVYRDKVYSYGDNTLLGGTQESVLLWMKNPDNKRVLQMIKHETYPDLYQNTPEETHGSDPLTAPITGGINSKAKR